MTVEAYLNPDFTLARKILFLIATLIGIGIGLGFVYLVTMLVLDKDISPRDRKWALMGGFDDKVQRLF